MLVNCGRCGVRLHESATICTNCGAELCTVGGSWYWRKAKTGIERTFQDENGKTEDIFGNVNPNSKGTL